MLESKTSDKEFVDLGSLADMTGFPVEMIKKELFNSSLDSEKVTLGELRKAMVNFIDTTMLKESTNS